MLSAVCDFPIINLKEHSISVMCCSQLKKIASEMHKMFKTAFGDNATGRTQILSGFSKFTHGKLLDEDCKYLHLPP
jgi:hypothetical protein